MIGALEDAEDYKGFEAAIIADYDVQSAVERELVLRLASLLWRLRRATTMETSLFEIQATICVSSNRAARLNRRRKLSMQGLGRLILSRPTPIEHRTASQTERTPGPGSGPKSVDPAAELARCFLRLANLPNYALDRLSRYEATLWRQAGRILFALDALDRRKPQDRRSRFRVGSRHGLPPCEGDDY